MPSVRAAFEACKVLRVLDVLDEHFLHGEKTGMENPTRSKQSSLTFTAIGGPQTEVWLHKLSFPDGSPAGFSTIGFLCVQRMCITDGLQLFDHYEGSRPLPIKIEQSQKIAWGQDDLTIKLQKLRHFTRLVLQVAVNRKAYEGRLFFLVAPLLKDTCEIDWNLVDRFLGLPTLETVGDAFLKFATSVHVYLSHLKKGEDNLETLKRKKGRSSPTEISRPKFPDEYCPMSPRLSWASAILTGGIESGLKVGTALDLCFGGPTPWNQRELNIRFEKDVHEKLEPSMILKYEHLERKIGYVSKRSYCWYKP
ncbi:hypothetical protein KEM48_003008 [Puccinia striiformis f. sp. tritici PST-130]|nr:hypothetical protein KEM48_003008 [Puccinia striiformis f. sp. tritici PST-130]